MKKSKVETQISLHIADNSTQTLNDLVEIAFAQQRDMTLQITDADLNYFFAQKEYDGEELTREEKEIQNILNKTYEEYGYAISFDVYLYAEGRLK